MGMTRPPIPKNQTMADPYGYDFTKFNAGGSAPRANNNDSKLVATQFADDPTGSLRDDHSARQRIHWAD
jgi:hypothetical protein